MCITAQQLDQLRLAKEQAEAASRAKAMFMAKVGHELKTPLNAIVGLAQLIRVNRQCEPQAAALDGWVDQIARIGWHMAEVIDALMELGPCGGALAREAEVVDVLGPLADAIAIVEQEALQRRIAIVLHGDVGAKVRADERALRQVLVNLLSNAVKYGREQGIVQVSVCNGASVRLSVRDSGPGLTPQQMERLFQPFERLDAHKRGISGHGLGLLVCRELATAMGGSIEVDSTAGLGCTFTVSLPAPAAAEA